MRREDQLDKTLYAISHQARRDMLHRVSEAPQRVTDLARAYPQFSLNAVSKHIKVLEDANLVNRIREGREHRIELNAEPMKEIEKWIQFFSGFWMSRLDNLNEMLKSEEDADKS